MKIDFTVRAPVRIFVLVALAAACTAESTDTSETGAPDTGTPPPPAVGRYAFASRFTDGSSVDYAGQTMRQVLALDLVAYVEGLTAEIDGGYFPVPGEVESAIEFYFDFDSATSGSVPHGYAATPATLQVTYDDISTNKKLADKVAGNDPTGQHRDWSTDLRGWTPGATPEGLLRAWFADIDAAAVARAGGAIPLGPDGAPLPSVAVSADGLHRAELIQKFLYGALNLSQGADDYLDDDLDGAGLRADNAEPSGEGSPYTALEHAWDEAFGYFGIARDALDWDDELLGGTAYADTYAPDGAIDLLSEVSYGVARYAGQRDRDAVVATDFSGDVLSAFIDGRALISSAGGDLDEATLATLIGYRDQAVLGWEKVIAASAVHYVNETLVDMSQIGTAGYTFEDHAAHWSELKGLALAFQFNPHSPMSDADFDALHALIGASPVLPGADPAALDAYRADLREARALLGETYGFADENLGDDDGLGGW